MTDLKGSELAFTSIGMKYGDDPYAANSLIVYSNPSLVSLGGLEVCNPLLHTLLG